MIITFAGHFTTNMESVHGNSTTHPDAISPHCLKSSSNPTRPRPDSQVDLRVATGGATRLPTNRRPAQPRSGDQPAALTHTPSRAVGLWTYSNVRDILTNPKYTGHMVWNGRARKSVGNKRNPSPNGSGHPNPCTRYWSTSTPSSRPKKSAATASAPAPPTKPTPSTRRPNGRVCCTVR